ncbi:MAG: lipoyl(octanoyl) transferase LipB [Syntrophaceae bacterium]
MEYGKAYRIQKTVHDMRVEGKMADTLLLLQHTPTFTIGKSGSASNILVPQSSLGAHGISLFLIERGGDVTYHGPGQIVGYPIIDLRGRGKDIHRFVHDLEEVLIRTVRDFSIEAERDETHPGVWVGKEELAAIGLSVRKWVSMHGFALNVDMRMDHFCLINPCGFSDRRATSMNLLLSQPPSIEEVTERLLVHFSEIFNTTMADGEANIQELL